MAIRLLFAPEVQGDIDEAYGWYEDRRPGLGEDFLICVEASVFSIYRAPEHYPKIFKDYRRCLIRRFPFAIFFEYENDTIFVYSIFHTSQNPTKWKKRLP